VTNLGGDYRALSPMSEADWLDGHMAAKKEGWREADALRDDYKALAKDHARLISENKKFRALYDATVEYVESGEDDISGIMAAFSALYGSSSDFVSEAQTE